MVKKILFWTLLVGVTGSVGWGIYNFVFASDQGLKPIYLIPKDAIYIIESEEPVENWETISTSEIWAHLKNNEYFAELTYDVSSLDTLFKENKTLFKLLGSRSLMISAHLFAKNKYDFLFIVDLKKVSKLSQIKNYLSTILSDGYSVSRRTYHDHEIIELYDRKAKETLYMSFIENLLVTSYTHLLVEASIDELKEPKIGRDLNFIDVSRKVGHEDLFRLYLQYEYLDDYLQVYTQNNLEYIKTLSEIMLYSGFSFDLTNNNLLVAQGYTNIQTDSLSYLHVLQKSGTGEITIPEIAPQRTAFYLGLGFDKFSRFYTNLEELQKENPAKFQSYSENYHKFEKLLKINIKENFIDWIDDEIAFLQMQSSGLGEKNEFAVILKANDGDEALENLKIILQQIKKKTPVKFKQVIYKGHPINFLSVKGFFKLLLGKFFADLEKPYFTIIDDYVIFSNHPQTLKNIINDHITGLTLSKSKDFNAFIDEFEDNTTLFAYVNTPLLHQNLKSMVSPDTKRGLVKNKKFITCFSQMGFHMLPSNDMFESKLILQYQDPNALEEKIQFAEKPENLILQSFGKMADDDSLDIALTNVMLLEKVDEEDLINVEEINLPDLTAKLYQEFFEDGSIKVEVPIKDGLKHGTYREYYINGNFKLKGRYKKDQQTGIWKAYDEEGNTLERKRY